jgi:hypothetical protein
MGGGQTETLAHFAEIRKQIIWGNKFIMFKIKSLMFDNWINSDLIYINDILNEKPNRSQLYSFIFHYLEENKLKIFRWKLLQYIIPIIDIN